jgi:hypothetical protein
MPFLPRWKERTKILPKTEISKKNKIGIGMFLFSSGGPYCITPAFPGPTYRGGGGAGGEEYNPADCLTLHLQHQQGGKLKFSTIQQKFKNFA